MLIGLQCAVRALSYGSRKPRTSNAMKRLAFISRHAPTQEQIELAATLGHEIIHVGDVDAFAPGYLSVVSDLIAGFDAVAAVHPNILLTQAFGDYSGGTGLPCWVFENGSRPVEGGKPQFFCKGVIIWKQEIGDTYYQLRPVYHAVETATPA
jgi:hypothetical protein